MPLRPFPFSFRVGTDICNVPRIRSIITRCSEDVPLQPLRRFLRRVFTDHERQYFWKRFGPEEEAFTKVDAISQFLAGRFAAKEACRKACKQMNSNSRGFQHIVILPVASPGASAHQSSRPQGLILDKPYEVWQDAVSTPQGRVDINELDGQLCEISISHDGDFATAVAIVPST